MDYGQEYQEKIEGSENLEDGIGERQGGETEKRSRRRIVVLFVIPLLLIGIISAYLYIRRSDSNHYLKYQDAGIDYFKKGEYKEAEKEFKEAVRSNPDRFETHYSLGVAYLKQNRLKEAATELIKAIELNPADIPARYSLGITFQRMGKFDLAMKVYYVILKMRPNSPQVFNNVGSIYLNLKDYEKAIYAFKRATELKKDYYPAYINLAKAYGAQGKRRLSIAEYQKVQKMASSEPDARSYAQIAENELAKLSKR